MNVNVQVPETETGWWRRRLWLGAYVIGFGLLFAQTLAAMVNQIAPPLPPYDSVTYISPSNAARCAEEGGTWVPNQPVQPPLPGSCYLAREIIGSVPQSKALCEQVGGIWEDPQAQPTPEPTTDVNGYCQGPLDREVERDAVQNKHAYAQTAVFAVGGGAAIIVALLLWHIAGVAAGLMAGGIFTLYGLATTTSPTPFAVTEGVHSQPEALLLVLLLFAAAYVGWRSFNSNLSSR